MRHRINISLDEFVRLYRLHQSARKVADLLECSFKTVLERLKEAGEPRRHSGGIVGELKYPADKLAAAKRCGYPSWDAALLGMTHIGMSSVEISEMLGKETTPTNIRSRLRYLKRLKATSSSTCGNG